MEDEGAHPKSHQSSLTFSLAIAGLSRKVCAIETLKSKQPAAPSKSKDDALLSPPVLATRTEAIVVDEPDRRQQWVCIIAAGLLRKGIPSSVAPWGIGTPHPILPQGPFAP